MRTLLLKAHCALTRHWAACFHTRDLTWSSRWPLESALTLQGSVQVSSICCATATWGDLTCPVPRTPAALPGSTPHSSLLPSWLEYMPPDLGTASQTHIQARSQIQPEIFHWNRGHNQGAQRLQCYLAWFYKFKPLNLQIQCNSYQITNTSLHWIRTKKIFNLYANKQTKKPQIAKAILRKMEPEKSGSLIQSILQSYSNQNNMVWGTKPDI